MNDLISQNLIIIRNLCQKYKVIRLYLFGSILNERFTNDSDIDFLVTFDDIPLENYADYYFGLKEELEHITGKNIDLVEEDTIQNPYFQNEVNTYKEKIYE